MKSVYIFLSTLLGAAAFLLPAQNASAQECSPDIACGVSISPASSSRVVLGQTITINFVKAGITESSCFVTNGNTWLASPDGAGGQITSYIMTNFILQVVNTEVRCNGTAGIGGGNTSCLGYTATYIVDADDINKPLSLGSPTVLPIKFGADGVQTFPATPKQIHFFAAAEGAGFNDSAFTSFSGNAYGQGQVSLTVVTPGLTITKICDTNCFTYGAPISFHGSVCNTGEVRLINITVTDTPAGGSPIAVTDFATTTSSGRAYDGTLTNGECVTYTGSYSPSGAGVALCGPFEDTVVASATTSGISSNFNMFATNSATCTVCTTPCITVTKNCDTVVIGSANTVSGSVTNCGDVPLTNITIVDNLYGTLATIASLEPGAGTIYSVLVTNATCGNFTNIVTATGNGICGGQVSDTDTNVCVVTEAPCIVVTKNCDTVVVGQGNHVTGTITNCGNVRLTNVTVVDNLYGTLLTGITLDPGEGGTFGRFVTNSCGNFTNIFTASGRSICGTLVTDTDTNVCVVTEAPCIVVTKNCDTVVVGQGNHVTGTITNCGNVRLTNVTVVDNLYGTLLTGITLDPGEGGTFGRFVTNNTCGNFTNIFTATGRSPCGTEVSDTDTNVCIVTEAPCIVVTKECDRVAIGLGNTVSGTVTNCGNITLTNISIVDNLYGTLATVASLEPGAGTTYSQLVTNNTCGEFPNIVTASGRSTCGTEVSANATNTCYVTEAPCIVVTKACDTVAIGLGNTVSGTVTNCGNITLTNISIVDNLYGTLATVASLEPGAGTTYSQLVTNNTCGEFPNIVTASGRSTCGTEVSANATNTCYVTEAPCITVTKECTPAVLGGQQTISGGVTNCGNVSITNIVVSDNQYGAITTIASLEAGAGTTYSKEFTATICGTTTNIVTAAGTTVCGSPILASATNTCFVECPPCIKVDKTVACAIGTNCGTFGEIATGIKGDTQNPVFCYSITVSNCGTIALTNNRVLDDKLGDLTASYFASPNTQFPVGGVITRTFKASWATDTTNTVVARGQSILTGQTVNDTNDAVALVIQASVSCNMQITSPDDLDGNANDGHVSLINDGAPHNVTFTIIVTSGNAPLANVTVVSPTLAGLGCSLPAPFSLAANSSFTNVCTVPVNCANVPIGGLTNVAVISAVVDTTGGACGYDANGNLISVVSTNAGDPCAVVIECISVPEICVTKEVVCQLPNGCDDNWSHLAIGAKNADDTQCPSFCYRIRVTNCGQEALTNITVVDNVLTNLAGCNFPTTLAVGQTVECIISGVEHCDNVTNTVTATGVGVLSGLSVSTNDTAAVVVRSISITCELTVNGEPTVEITCDGQTNLVDHAVRICNTGELPLVASIYAPIIVALGGDCTNVAFLRLALLPGECTNVVLCTDVVTCPTDCGLAFSNWVQVTAQVDESRTNVCSWTRNDSNEVVAVTASTECSAIVTCKQPEACRTTGGGRQDDPLVYPADVRYVTHGGQVGAPVGNHVCIVTTNFPLGNPCIHGRWTHVRHQQGGNKGNFHARYYDTLECACLDTNTTAATVIVPGVNGAADQTYVNLVYGPGTTVDGLCNPGHNPAGPEPRPAPANKIAFTGVGDWTESKGGRAPRSVLFRVDLEDRSEPGGSHPGGAKSPADRYRLRIWVLSDAELAQLRGGAGDRFLLNFRNAISACNGINVQDGASVPNGAAAFGVRAPDVDDGGELLHGNHQIHPAIKDCDPFNPTGPGLPPGGN